MDKYLEKGKELIKLLINAGYEAYFIGQCVRNVIMEKENGVIEITTNATPGAILPTLSFARVEEKEDHVEVFYGGYTFYITTFRVATTFKDNRKPVKYHYSKNLIDELANRDYTINALAMSHSGKITDAYMGVKDIAKKRIALIGKPKVRFIEDPRRILSGVALMSELGFRIDGKTKRAMISKRKLLVNVKPEDIYNNLKRILEGTFHKAAMSFFLEAKFGKYLPGLQKGIEQLTRRRHQIVNVDDFLTACFIIDPTQKQDYMQFMLEEETQEQVIHLANAFPKSKYDDFSLYYYGLEIAKKANKLNYILRRGKKLTKKIEHQYDLLTIHDQDDLALPKQEMMQILKDLPTDTFIQCLQKMEQAVILKELDNEYDALYQFVAKFALAKKTTSTEIQEAVSQSIETEEKEKLEFNFDEQQLNNFIKASTENELAENLVEQGELIKNYTELKINQLEKRLREQEKMIQQKDEQLYDLEKRTLKEKLNNDVDKLVQRNLETLKELKYIDTSYNEKLMLSRELQKIYRQFLSNVESKYQDIMKEEKNDEEI